MKVQYKHISCPEEIKVYNTEKAYKQSPFTSLTQEQFDEMELMKFYKRKEEGIILEFEVIEK